jgi:HAD superfamily hydrolase (TIGR01509 family)
MPARVRVVLCDLDDTLFDHLHTTRVALERVREATPELTRWSLDELHVRHGELLERLHLEVLAGRLSIDDARAERFGRLLTGGATVASRDRAMVVARYYRSAYELAWRPVVGALPLARAIKAAGLCLVVVTNNVVVEQRLKIERTGLSSYVDHLVTSEEAGTSKPDPRIFHLALERAGATVDDAVMFGDAWGTDIVGARAAGVRAVWFNRSGDTRPEPSVSEVRDLEPTAGVLAALIGAT